MKRDAAGRRRCGERDDMKKHGLKAALPGISTDEVKMMNDERKT